MIAEKMEDTLSRLLSEQNLFAALVIQEGCVKYANSLATSIFKVGFDELLSMPPGAYGSLVHEDDRRRFMESVRRGGPAGSLEVRTNTVHQKWVRAEFVSLKFDNNDACAVLAIEMTAEKEAIRRLSEVEDELNRSLKSATEVQAGTNDKLHSERDLNQRLLDSIPAELMLVDARERTVVLANRKLIENRGESVIGKKCHLVLRNSPGVCPRCELEQATKSGRARQIDYCTEGAGQKWYSLVTAPIKDKDGNVVYVLHIASDITKRRTAELALQQSRAGLAAAQRLAHLGNWQWDPVLGSIDFSDEALRILGIDRFDGGIDDFARVVHERDRAAFLNTVREAVRLKKGFDFEHRLAARDGRTGIVRELGRYRTGPDPAGKIFAVMQDITEARAAEMRLKQSHESMALVNRLLRLSMDDLPLTKTLDRFLSLIAGVSWLGFDTRSGIWLRQRDNRLHLVSGHNLPKTIALRCRILQGSQCICGRSASAGKMQIVPLHNVRNGMRRHGHACLPLKSGRQTIGVLNIYLRPGQSYGPKEMSFLRTLANLLSGIIIRRRTAEELKGMNKSLLHLSETSRRLQMTLDMDETLAIGVGAFNTLGYDRVRVYLMQDGILVGARANHISSDKFRSLRLHPLEQHPKAAKVLETRQVVLVEEKANRYSEILEMDGVKQSASLPLISGDKLIGIISLDNKHSQREIVEEELQFLMTLANQVASGIESAMLYQENLRKYRTLSTLYDVSSAISGTLELEKILNLIVIKIVKLLKADVCSVLLQDESGRVVTRSIFEKSGTAPDKRLVGFVERYAAHSAPMKSVAVISRTDQEKDPLFRIHARRAGIVTMLTVPLALEHVLVGQINIFMRTERHFAAEELSLLSSLSSQAAIVIENSRLYSKIKSDKDALSGLLEVSSAINSTLDKDRLLEQVLDKAAEFTSADHGLLMLIKDGFLEVRYSKGRQLTQARARRIRMGSGIAGWVAKSQKPAVVNDVRHDKRCRGLPRDIRSVAAIPLMAQRSLIGVLLLESRALSNFKRYWKSLNILTNHIAIAIQNVQWYEEIRTFNQRLKSEIELATRELREKNIELRKMDALKTDFVSNVSHELRTPLTSIAGYTKLLLMGKLGPVNDKQEQSLRIVSEETERLTRLINNVLDLSRLESGKVKFHLEEINLKQVATEVVESLAHLASEKHIRLRLIEAELPVIKASRDLIKQVFLNLLNNSLKFTAEGGEIEIALNEQKDSVRVDISDTGPGIPEDKIPKLFNKFYQVDSSMTRQHSGTGLGLVICKHIVEAHKGQIWAKSRLGRGSTFSFSLPLKRQAHRD